MITRRRKSNGLGPTALVLAVPLAACDTTPVAQSRGTVPVATGSTAARTAAAAVDDANRIPTMTFRDEDFRGRDPFKEPNVDRGGRGTIETTTQILLREVPLDSLRLVAVVGSDNPYAMVIDPTGQGTILRRGNFVGHPDILAGRGEGDRAHEVPWRVTQILGARVTLTRGSASLEETPAEVVFRRDDPSNPLDPGLERRLVLRPQGAVAVPQSGAGGSSDPNAALPLPAFGPNGTPYLPTNLGGQAGRIPGLVPGPNGTLVQSYTTIIPPQPAAAAPPTTVIVQTNPQGQPTGVGNTPGTNPYGLPNNGSTTPPPVRIEDGPTTSVPTTSLPTSGLGRTP